MSAPQDLVGLCGTYLNARGEKTGCVVRAADGAGKLVVDCFGTPGRTGVVIPCAAFAQAAGDSIPPQPVADLQKPLRPRLRQTHTFAILEVSAATFADVKARLEQAGPEYLQECLQVEDGVELLVLGATALKVES